MNDHGRSGHARHRREPAGIRAARGFEDAKIVGQASTIRLARARPDSLKLTTYDPIEHFQAGTVLIFDGEGMNRQWAGDNVGTYSQSKGLAGVVIRGCARDLAGWRQAGMSVYCTGSATKDKQPASTKSVAGKVPAEIGDVTVEQVDVSVADEDGVVGVPIEVQEPLMEKMKILFEVKERVQAIIAKKKAM